MKKFAVVITKAGRGATPGRLIRADYHTKKEAIKAAEAAKRSRETRFTFVHIWKVSGEPVIAWAQTFRKDMPAWQQIDFTKFDKLVSRKMQPSGKDSKFEEQYERALAAFRKGGV